MTRLPPLLLTFLACLVLQTQVQSYPGVNVWPKPRTFQWDHPYQATYLSPNFSIIMEWAHRHPYPPFLVAIRRYTLRVLTEHHRPLVPPAVNISDSSPALESLRISVLNTLTPLQHGVDESYTLVVPSSGPAELSAGTLWGAMRGLETFSQLVWGVHRCALPVGVHIWDAPLFPHRGLMLDTSRNFYPVEDVMRTIAGMSYNKMNVFHWHLTDSHSFPLVLPSEPELAAKGSYGSGMEYTPEDVGRVVLFGLENGVRVLPEIDSPAHTGSWAGAYPDIVTCANMFWWPAGSSWDDRLASEPGTGHLNPLHPKTYQVLNNVIRDVASMFPESLYHGGADEIVPGCWKADPSIQSYLSKNGTSLSQLLEKFIGYTHPYIVSLNKTVVYWEDVLLDANVRVNASLLPPETTILQTWNNGPNNTKLIVSAGYRVIVSSSEFYYLDCGHGDFLGNDSQYNPPPTSSEDSGSGGSWCGPFKTWQNVYNYDITYDLTDVEAKLVLGGEVALWSEQADPTVLDARIWPRSSALAETLWSGNRDETGKKRYAEATDRLNEWRYRMVSRGINAEPIQPLWCIKNPGMCNTVNSS